jgi:hypothetical protein
VRLHLRLYAGQDDELIRWLEQFDDQPYGAKTQAVKDALLRGLGEAPGQASGPAAATAAWDLSDVRRVVEAAVETALARFGGQVITPTVAPSEDDEAEGLLDALGESLVLKD